MRIEYIFIRKSNEPKKVAEKIYTLQPPFKPFLKGLFSDVTDSSFKVKHKSKEYTVTYYLTTCESEEADTACSMYNLTVSIDDQRKDRCAEILTSVNQAILCSEGKEQFNIILAYDGVSKYYCDRAYPDLNEFERNVRNLVFRIVTKAFGAKWLDKTTSEEMKNSLKASIQTRPKALRDERLIETALYEMDIKELENYLFVPRRDISCEQVVDVALSPENLKQMTKEQIEAKLNTARPRSLWERQFSKKVSIEGLQEALQQIRILRNQVAHAKPFSFADFKKCRSALQEINPQIEQAIFDISDIEYDLPETIRTLAGFGDAWTAAVAKALEFNREISAAMSEIGGSLKEAYKALELMPSPAEREVLRQMEALQPVISMVQSLPLDKIQRSYEAIHAALPSQAVILAANQAAQRMQNILPQYDALLQAQRMSDLFSSIERPALLAHGLMPEPEQGEMDEETRPLDQEHSTSPDGKRSAGHVDNDPEDG
ncbi:MAG: hypothetical protein GX942_03950 [Papillibacter sp.]|nr:hypothetical protein [Papillibacter sp.]